MRGAAKMDRPVFIVVMSQAFAGRLETAIKELTGDDYISIQGGYCEGSTAWFVDADYPVGTTADQIQEFLWDKFPGPSIEVYEEVDFYGKYAHEEHC